VIWANGSFAHVADLVTRGKRAIFMTYVRVTQESCVPEVRRRFASSASAVIEANPRELVDVAMRHIHPLTLTYMRHSTNFPVHPEFILWSVPDEGILMRVLVREMFAYDPAIVDLNQQALVAHKLDLDLVHYVTDSDDLFALSLTPADKDIEWYARPQVLDVRKVASWWLHYDSPINDVAAGGHFYIHAKPRTPAKWRRAELQSDMLVQHLIGTREGLRLLAVMDRPDLGRARQVLAAALLETKLARMLRASGPWTLLLPRNGAILRWLLEGGDALLQPGNTRRLMPHILGHLVIGRVQLRAGEDAVLKTASGAVRQLTWNNGTAEIDGIAVAVPGFELGRYRSYLIDAVLPATVGG